MIAAKERKDRKEKANSRKKAQKAQMNQIGGIAIIRSRLALEFPPRFTVFTSLFLRSVAAIPAP
jgi:hypothetical protein